VSAALTVVDLAMRSVMEIGGACAEGGPFVPVRSCPTGVPALLVGGIWLGLVFAGLYVWQSFRHAVPSLAGLLWPALFLSLGWNFLEFGLEPPGGGGAEWGWLVCAVVFFAMGGLPLLAVVPAIWRRFTGKTPPSRVRGLLVPRRPRPVATPGPVASRWVGWETPSGTAAEPASSDADDLVGALERLDALHRSGALDAEEYESAKRRILGPEGP
jgi:hypothetical protein